MDVNVLDARDRTPLMVAAEHDAVSVIRALLFAGADATLRDSNGNTAKDIAADPACLALLARPDNNVYDGDDLGTDGFSETASTVAAPLNQATENTVTPPQSPLTFKTVSSKPKPPAAVTKAFAV